MPHTPTEFSVREHVVLLLTQSGAHLDLWDALRDVPPHLMGVRPPGLPKSLWELVEHLRVCQWDIVRFSTDEYHESPPFPEGYWPANQGPAHEAEWYEAIAEIQADLARMVKMVRDTSRDLCEPFPWGQRQTLLREAMLIADHNAYHLGQIVYARRALGDWPPQEEKGM